jgi:hypothetical protein
VARAYLEDVTVHVADLPEVRELYRAAAYLLSTLGERGEMKSYDREPAVLNRALDVIAAKYPKIAEGIA